MGVGPVLDPVRRSTLEGHRIRQRGAVAYRGRRLTGLLTSPRQSQSQELSGRDRGGDERTLSLLEEFVAGDLIAQTPAGRILATVLFTDIVDSTARAAALGDSLWAQVLDRHDAIARSAICSYGGRFVKETGDGVLAVFEAPARGIECAKRLRSALSHAGIAIRAGIHTGEVELRGDDVSGIGVHIAARVAALAGAGELLTSRTVKDLVTGTEYTFASRGVHRLRGVPERWEVLAVR
ncbi:MAG TPA: adenylate/guanylate cyclase domain-containing protein [Solirubrobacteraceae bacterium]|nr:adenylate/guanylate cyclase domain-containing protein [Solirubrobacteraceae bacterium]